MSDAADARSDASSVGSDDSGEPDACTLCGLSLPNPPVTDAGVDGSFCCRGCLEVARTLEDPAGVDADDARDAVRGTDESAPGSADATVPDDAETAYLRVDGMHCASCEAFLEGRAGGVDGVAAADANFPADAMRVHYDSERTDPGAVADAVAGVGYTAAPTTDADGVGDDDETIGRLLVGGFFGMMAMLWYVLFLYPTYFGLPTEALLFGLRGRAGSFLLANVWVSATIVLGYTGAPLLRGAYVAVRTRQPNMDLLVALAATTAYLYSTLAILLGRVEVYFDVTVVVIMAVTVGTYYEERVKRRAVGTLTDLTRDRVAEARLATADGTETVPVEAVEGGDRIVVRSGERVPVDGTIREGTAAVDESLVTGESLPVRRGPGATVRGGTVVSDGRFVVEADDGTERTLDRVVSLLWDVRGEGAPQQLADALATIFVPVVLVLGTLAFLVHLALGAPPTEALLTGLAVLVVSCPCALGLATPLAIAAGTRSLLADGVVLTDGSAVETADEVDVVALDKTGTLTTGEMALREAIPADGTDRAELLGRAAAVEARSDHPVAAAVVDAAAESDASGGRDGESVFGPDSTVEGFETHPGRGVSGHVDGGPRVTVGGESLFDEDDIHVPSELRDRYDAAEAGGHLAAYVGWDDAVRGVLVAVDDPRPGWRAAVAALSDDRRVVVLTGDEGPAADRLRDADGVDEVYAGLPPEAKTETVRRLRESGTVAMVGDGSNDAPALAAADLGIAVASGTELAADAADAVLVGRDLRSVDRAFDTLAATRRRVRENLVWAFLYNAIAVPAAVLGVVTPLLAAVAMAASSLLVVGNSARSLGPDPDTDEESIDGGGDGSGETSSVTPDPNSADTRDGRRPTVADGGPTGPPGATVNGEENEEDEPT
ncbi:heavy metal translocating P-type ATPase [Halobaculum rubrum]|uniref:heavy metal translocating P-type ATPase n=1 Tax=Halobaculum rubrum TaxID=2872158 RepID=UPI001CA3DA29|nr:heavy metal translocating P-type ATPase [Halobaculum rubrum]QZX99199.1 heavy metal translocating P-type ATPase [Halobaculum rubrum]